MTDESVFAAALAIGSPADRAAYLDRACAGNPALRGEVEHLLAAHAASNPLDRPPQDLARTGAHEPAADEVGAAAAVGDRVGPYKLLERIGEGGMGEVWVADQLEPIKRRVALKLIKPGMDSRSVLGRFEAERQALAVMDHPNIAKVLDAGTTPDGRPYFVMELVKGTPITEFCDARRLTPKQRLELFVPVCQAIQHAHQKGIIHRDIKPSNVLVELHDDRAVAKVIDFGVAKAIGQQLTEKTIYTGFGALVGTPAYMAPEQATFNALDVDTRADVYALGVLLYELLAGSPPIESDRMKKAALDEILRIVRDEEPPRPSQRLSTSQAKATIAATRQSDPLKLSQLMKGELDWIVMKALEKDRTRRYDTATALAKDVQRYLAGDAVEACPPTLGYRLRKSYRRNRAAVLVGGAFAAVLLAAAGVSVAFGLHADASRRLAEDAKQQAAQDRDTAVERERDTQDALRQLNDAQDRQQADQYIWDLQTVPLHFQPGNIADVKRLLDRQIPAQGGTDRRSFEWHYWDRLLNSEIRTEQLPGIGKLGQGYWAASPDGSRVAVLTPPARGVDGESPVLTVWDAGTDRELLRHIMPIKLPPPQPGVLFPSRMVKPLFSPDGRRVAVEWGYSLRSGPRPVVGGERLCQVIDVGTRKALVSADAGTSVPLGGGYEAVGAFSRDGHRFASQVSRPLPAEERKLGPGFGLGLGQSLITVWDLDSGRETGVPVNAKALAGAILHPSGDRFVLVRQLAEKSVFRFTVRDIASGQESPGWDVPAAWVSDYAVSADGERVAAAVAGKVRQEAGVVKMWDLSGKETASWELPNQQSGPNVSRQFFSPEGSKLVVVWGSERGPTFTVLDAKTGTPFPTPQGISFDNAVIQFAVSLDGKQLAATSNNVLRVWDVTTGRLLKALRGHVAPVVATGFRSASTRLWSVEAAGFFKEWNLAEKQPVTVPVPVPPLGGVFDPAFAVSPEGSRVAVHFPATKDQEETVRVHDRAGKVVQALAPAKRERAPGMSGEGISLALSREGRRLVLARADLPTLPKPKGPGPLGFGSASTDLKNPDLTVWDVDSGVVLFQKRLGGLTALQAGLFQGPAVALSLDGRVCVLPTKSAEPGARVSLRVFDLDAKRDLPPLTLPGGINQVLALGLSHDGSRVAVAGMNFDAATNRGTAAVLVGRTDGVGAFASTELLADVRLIRGPFDFQANIAWHPDGSRFAFGYSTPNNEDGLAVCDATTGRSVVTLERPLIHDWKLRRLPRELAYSPDGKRIAVFLTGNNGAGPSLHLWDAACGKEVLTLPVTLLGNSWRGGGARVTQKTLGFSANGQRLVAWEVRGGCPRLPDAPPNLALAQAEWDATPRPEPKK